MNDVVLIYGNFSSNNLNEQILKSIRKKICSSNDEFCKKCVFDFKKTEMIIFFHTDSKIYKIQDIELICNQMNLQNFNENEIFFVISQAEKLTGFAANKLLKRIEEPHKGFNFILSTNNKELLLETIYSRCNVLIHIKKNVTLDYLDNLVFSFNQALDESDYEFVSNLNLTDEAQISEFIDHYIKIEINKRLADNPKLKVLFWAQEHLPLTGSCKQFLQILFLKLLDQKNESPAD